MEVGVSDVEVVSKCGGPALRKCRTRGLMWISGTSGVSCRGRGCASGRICGQSSAPGGERLGRLEEKGECRSSVSVLSLPFLLSFRPDPFLPPTNSLPRETFRTYASTSTLV